MTAGGQTRRVGRRSGSLAATTGVMAAPERTHYDVLGIARDADASAVRTAWKLHVQAWHPDRFGEELKVEAERQTALINEAYSVLRDSSRRAAYDCRLAADELAARPEPAPTRRMQRTATPHPMRESAAPVGSPMPQPVVPRTFGEQVSSAGAEAWQVVRRHPRWFGAAAAVWLVVFGGSVVLHVASGPTLPAPRSERASASAIVADSAQLEDLEDLADRARDEAKVADAELEQLMREDALAAQREAAAAERQARIDAARQRQAPKGASGGGAAPQPGGVRSRDGRKIVRVMPSLG